MAQPSQTTAGPRGDGRRFEHIRSIGSPRRSVPAHYHLAASTLFDPFGLPPCRRASNTAIGRSGGLLEEFWLILGGDGADLAATAKQRQLA
jgi:hypothetical protein